MPGRRRRPGSHGNHPAGHTRSRLSGQCL